MTRVPIEMYVPLSIAPSQARSAAERVLARISADSTTYHALKVTPQRGGGVEPHWEFPITLTAKSADRFFPTFDGSLIVTPLGTTCEVWLQGSYAPPLGKLGAQIDATVLRGAAQSSLRAFLQWFTDDIKQAAGSSEA